MPAQENIQRPAIAIEGVHTRFGSNVVHENLSFGIAKASVAAIIGGSGAGKSVLLREILGLLRPSAGRIEVLGQDVWSLGERAMAELRTRFGVLFQNGALFSALNVADNVAVPLREQLSLPARLIPSIVNLRLELSGLPKSAGRKMPSELSGGMRKRAALARALALEPEILFLDEPTSGLDPISARAFDSLVRELCDNLGITIYMITHDLDTISSIADKVIVLAHKQVLSQGTYDEVRNSEDEWVRKYFASGGGARAVE